MTANRLSSAKTAADFIKTTYTSDFASWEITQSDTLSAFRATLPVTPKAANVEIIETDFAGLAGRGPGGIATDNAGSWSVELIGQLTDQNYPRKLTALSWEFVETGVAKTLGYESAADLADTYPAFFRNSIQPYIAPAVDYLLLTQESKQWVANLHSLVFSEKHRQRPFGPSSNAPAAGVAEYSSPGHKSSMLPFAARP